MQTKKEKYKQNRYRPISYAGPFDDWQDAQDARLYADALRRNREQMALNAYFDGDDNE